MKLSLKVYRYVFSVVVAISELFIKTLKNLPLNPPPPPHSPTTGGDFKYVVQEGNTNKYTHVWDYTIYFPSMCAWLSGLYKFI